MPDRNTIQVLRKMQTEDRAEFITTLQPIVTALRVIAERIEWLELPWYQKLWRRLALINRYRNLKGIIGVLRYRLKKLASKTTSVVQ